jgi:hypothetical protein
VRIGIVSAIKDRGGFPKAFESIALLPDAIAYQHQGNMVKAKSKFNSRRAYYYEGGELLSR